ncbi:MAG: class I SAM-dependent methyltransferase [Candidatus Bathyarchaeum tardum]|nr:MAG: class I SAM-dependent methyltransferase [Candidatus Bathyarchaeum tardum]
MQDWKQKRSNKQHYDLQAGIYDKQYISEQDNKIESLLKSLDLKFNELVLDLGCGTGFLFEHISEKAGFIVGADVSKKALLYAKKRIQNKSNVDLVCADADNTPFVDDLFDKIFSVTVLQNMPEPTRTILEMKRTGKPEALFAITGLKKKFTQQNFVDLLKRSQLKLVMFNNDEALKGYVAVCSNL